MSTSTSIEAERDRVLSALTLRAPSTPIEDLPDVPGLYTLWAASRQTIESLALADVTDQVPLLERPLYLGKAEGPSATG